ncbi:putative ABC transporter permease protein [Microlunatus phosphovorus NM-1]|uniref:Putative ABC transporter permease protein n=1 Tax=Microlunatus phosphovorus (strain ATCC 700054 / DSM 10555 / JCM 9379 / NBRC 101784 / NCIMB 13414 / VKM Ac-1990 / NM-1) TaxID=1032480 RepID=F5XI24_MICPN|nr:ABC transporter permease [Microlunatus phosphovorus]BAK35693.1 putative ABC transporter permease protein [Microlunatus phosphovorus NM-1]
MSVTQQLPELDPSSGLGQPAPVTEVTGGLPYAVGAGSRVRSGGTGQHGAAGGDRRGLVHGRGLVGLILLGALVLAGVLAPILAPYPPNEQIAGANLLTPSAAHLFGTDHVNRDVFSRTLYGIRTDLLIVFVAVPIGALLGTLAALLGTVIGAVDVALQRVFDVLLAFPTLIFAIGLTAVIGPGAPTVIVVIAVLETPIFARLLRSSILKVRALPYVETAEAIGATHGWVLRRHVLPNAVEPLGVQLALSPSLAVFVESAMSFLGIGVRPPQPSLGSLIAEGIDYVDSNLGFVLGPLIPVVILVLSLQLIAQGLGAARRVTR